MSNSTNQPEQERPSQDSATANDTTVTDTAWDVPAGWILDPEPRPMRLATYLVPDEDDTNADQVEVAVSRFDGTVGTKLANINRWRRQLGLEGIEEEQLEGSIERFAANGFEGYETRIESPQGVTLAAGVYETAADQTWFLRANAPTAEAADRIQADFSRMARSFLPQRHSDDTP